MFVYFANNFNVAIKQHNFILQQYSEDYSSN
jgi:hypothetical protein